MWKLDGFQDLQPIAIATTEARRVPPDHAVDRKNGRVFETLVVETARAVGLMAEHVFNWTIVAQHFPDLAFRLARITPPANLLPRRMARGMPLGEGSIGVHTNSQHALSFKDC